MDVVGEVRDAGECENSDDVDGFGGDEGGTGVARRGLEQSCAMALNGAAEGGDVGAA